MTIWKPLFSLKIKRQLPEMARILEFSQSEPTARELMERALEPHILLGMPHLTPSGLSETWLMKELGHRHWLMLARSLGLDDAGFRAENGDDVYAAICATSLRNGALHGAKPNDILFIRSSLTPVSRTQVSTHHRMSIGNTSIADVELISTFVHHAVKGDNHSIARINMGKRLEGRHSESDLATLAVALRNGSLATHMGLSTEAESPLRTFEFFPSTLQEFNGAGLLYFAEFQAIAERAMTHWFGETSTLTPRRRDVLFSGNCRPDAVLSVELVKGGEDCRAYQIFIRRNDRRVIARIYAS